MSVRVFDWGLFVALAEVLRIRNLTDRNPDEASLRSCVSRLYYAAFHKVRDAAISSAGYVPPLRNDSVHKHLIEFLMGSSNRGFREMGKKLKELKRWRATCDYDSGPADFTGMANASMDIVNDVLRKINVVLKDDLA